MITWLVSHPWSILALWALTISAAISTWVVLCFTVLPKPEPEYFIEEAEAPKTDRLLWSELDEIDWREFSAARTRWERESEFSDRISNPKASVHIFPTERKAEWRFDGKDAA